MKNVMDLPAVRGKRLIADPWVPEFKVWHRQERKWAHRVMWNRYQRFTLMNTRVMIITGSSIVAHPNTVDAIGKTIVIQKEGQS